MDDVYMRRALELAERGTGLVSPNPLVGAVLIREGRVVGEGWHEGPGRPHAEIGALEAAREGARSATLYVTLEPCAHYGRTPPCAPRIARAGVTRVVAAMTDPNPLVDGQGTASLRDAGVAVDLGLMEAEAAAQNAAFLKHVRTGLPFVTLKMAASLDGKVAAHDGSSRWITGEKARADVHRMRAAADAILIGAGTALRDDPSLTCRDPGYRGRPKLRVVVDGRGTVPATLAMFTDGLAPTLVATTDATPRERRAAWASAGAEVLVVDRDESSSRVDLAALVAALGKRDVQRILIEGGPTLAWASRTIVDEIVVFLAPILIGGAEAPSAMMGQGVGTIADALRVEVTSVARVGDDLKVVGRVHGDR